MPALYAQSKMPMKNDRIDPFHGINSFRHPRFCEDGLFVLTITELRRFDIRKISNF
jgi:hypothetical protein